MSKRVLIATGGTGGHIFPAMALAQQLANRLPESQILFIGGGLQENKYFDRQAFAFKPVACGTFIHKSPKAIFRAFGNIIKGVWQSRSIIREFKPDVVVGFGSYYAFPPLVAAKMLSVPFVLHEANSIPGKVNRLLSPWAVTTGIHFPETARLLKGKTIEVGMPLRPGFQHGGSTPAQARMHFGLKEDCKTLLIFGGSQGAQSINLLVREALCQEAISELSFQILHITGDAEMAEVLQQDYRKKGITACVKAYENRMDLAWQAADIVICRSGAGAIAEQLEFEVPGILIPFPRAADNHQEHNADFMVAIVGGAVKLSELAVPSRLRECVIELLKEDGALLDSMKLSMKNYKKRARSRDLFSLVNELL